jgi:hypothetical protein
MSNIGRRNSIVKRLWNGIRGRSDVEDLNNPYIIVSNFKETNERECGKIDSRNERKYNELLRKANKAEKTIKNSGLSMNVEVPPPPHPSNRDRYILWKKRNSVKHVIPQTKAVSFLTREGYTLDKDYEAYQAVDLANEIRKKKGLPTENEDETIYFKNVFTQRDRNIFRKRSMIRTGTRRPKDSISNTPSESSLDSLDRLEQSKYLRVFEKRKSPGVSSAPNLPVHMENDQTIINGAVNASAPPSITTTIVTGIQKPVASAPPQIVAQQEQQGQQGQQGQIQQPQPLPLPDNIPKLKAVGFGGTLTF